MLSAGMLACEIETSKVAAIFSISYKAVQYWKKQVLEKKIPNEHESEPRNIWLSSNLSKLEKW